MNIYKISLLDYARAFDLEMFASTEEEAREMAMREEPDMNITKVVCLTSIDYVP
jgi:hypothetical protein